MGLFGETCQHCHKKKTRRKDDAGRFQCDECALDAEIRAEAVIRCPTDGATMVKEVIETDAENIIIDRCPTCRGVWLDRDELDLIQEACEDGGSDFTTGLATGLAVGIASGS